MKQIRLNLLPWRAERRLKRKEELKNLMMVAGFVGFLCTAAFYWYLTQQINKQNERIAYLDNELKLYVDLDKQQEIRKQTLDRLIERLNIIGKINGQRLIAIEALEGIALSLPEDMFLTSIDFADDSRINITGITTYQNIDSVSNLINELKKKDFLSGEPSLKSAEDKKINNADLRVFAMEMKTK